MATDFAPIAEKLGAAGTIRHMNKSGNLLDLRDWYTKKLARKVYKRYQKDFELLGYKEEFDALVPMLPDTLSDP